MYFLIRFEIQNLIRIKNYGNKAIPNWFEFSCPADKMMANRTHKIKSSFQKIQFWNWTSGCSQLECKFLRSQYVLLFGFLTQKRSSRLSSKGTTKMKTRHLNSIDLLSRCTESKKKSQSLNQRLKDSEACLDCKKGRHFAKSICLLDTV